MDIEHSAKQKQRSVSRFNSGGILLISLSLICVGSIAINMVYNDIQNQQYANLLYDFPLPPQTEVLDRETVCFCPPNGGKYVLNFSETLVTSLRREQIESYYANIWFPPLQPKAIPEEYQRVNVNLDFDYPLQIDGRMEFKASIGEPFYSGGLFDWRCSQQ